MSIQAFHDRLTCLDVSDPFISSLRELCRVEVVGGNAGKTLFQELIPWGNG